MKTKLLKIVLPLLVICSCIFMLLFSCRKVEVAANHYQGAEHFFKTERTVKPEVQRVLDKLKQLNSTQEFINRIITNDGYAQWDKAIITHKPSTSKNGTNKTMEGEEDTIIVIPIVPDSIARVNAFIAAKLNGDMIIKLFEGDGYKKLLTTANGLSADEYAKKFMAIEKEVFGYTDFKIDDLDLFKENMPSSVSITSRWGQWIPLGPSCGYWLYQNEDPFVNYYWSQSDIICTATDIGDEWWDAANASSGGWGYYYSGGGWHWVANGNGGSGSGYTPTTSSYVYFVKDSIVNSCLNAVMNKMRTNSSSGNYFRNLYSVFDSSTLFTVSFRDLDSALMNSSDDYGEAYPPITLLNGTKEYSISLNKDLLIKCSQEWVADTYLHELMHAYLGTQNFQFGTNAQHNAMASKFLDKMANTLIALFPNLPLIDAYCISFTGMSHNEDNAMPQAELTALREAWKTKLQRQYPLLYQYDAQQIDSIGIQYSNAGVLGNRMTNCIDY